ncbi:hypothetical protein NMG60_11000206 [Bertholletia excelsa]
MAASVEYRQQEGNLGIGMKEKNDDPGLFFELQRSDKDQSGLFLHDFDDFDDRSGSKQDSSLMSNVASTLPAEKTGPEDLLNSENDRTDYDWLLTPPGTPLFPSLDKESKKTVTSNGVSNGHAAAPSTLTDPIGEPASSNTEIIKRPVVSTGSNSSITANRRPLSSGGLTATARSATPNGRAALPTTAKALRPLTPTSRATLTSAVKKSLRPSTPTSRATLPSTAKPTRTSTPSSRGPLPSIKPAAAPVRSSTPAISKVRSSTPTARPSAHAASRSTPRSSTPTHRSSTPSTVTNTSGPAGRSSSVTKSGPPILKYPVSSCGASLTVKSRPQKSAAVPGFSSVASNLKTPMPERPASTSKVRPAAPSIQFTSIKSCPNGPRRQSSSPSRGRIPNSNGHNNGSLAVSRGHSMGSDDVNPVLIGTKMVERVVNMRKLAPPKQDDSFSKSNNSGKSSSSQENSGFGRSLSKKSLDMALRHMDIRQSISGNFHPLVTNGPASSAYSLRSGSTKGKRISILDSPLATSSNSSSEPSVNYSSKYLDGIEVEDNDLGNERVHFSLASHHDG